MNYTKNYRLPQWVKEDRIMMEDFNAMNSSIENGLTSTAAKADSAVSTANTAQQIAQQAAAAKPYATGSYLGHDTKVTITLGFRPSFVIISGMKGSDSNLSTESFDRFFAMTAGNIMTSWIAFTDTGFTVSATSTPPYLTVSGRRYDYIAFK